MSNKRRGRGRGSVVVAAGSVWESRMKSDEVRGGIKVLNAEEERVENGGGNARLKRSPIGVAASGGKRKTRKSDSSEGLDKNPIQVGRGKPEKNSEENCNKKSLIHTRKVGAGADKFDRSIIHSRKVRSEKGAAEVGKEGGESGEGHEKSSRQLWKSKSDSGSVSADNNSVQMRRTKSDLGCVSDESRNVIDESDGTRCEKVEDENKKNDCDESDENCKDFEVCQEKVISSSSDNVSVVDDEADEGDDEEEEEEVEEMDEEVKIEMAKESFDVKEINIPESNSKVVMEPENKKIVLNEPEKKVAVSEPENKKVVINEPEKKKVVKDTEPKKVVSAHMRFHHRNERPVSVPLAVKQSSPIRRHSTIYQNFSKANSSKVLSFEFHHSLFFQISIWFLGFVLIFNKCD